MNRLQRILASAIAIAALGLAPLVQAATFSDYLENKLVDWLFRGQAYTPPATLYVGLLTGACSDSAAGTEVSGGSYARVAVVSSLTAWAGTQSAGSTTASSGAGGATSNNASITFPAPSANWGVISHFALYDAASAGNMLLCRELTVHKTVNNGDAAPTFSAAAVTIQVDD